MTRGDITPSPGVSEQGKGEAMGKTINQGQIEGLGEALLPERRQTEMKPEKQSGMGGLENPLQGTHPAGWG